MNSLHPIFYKRFLKSNIVDAVLADLSQFELFIGLWKRFQPQNLNKKHVCEISLTICMP